MRSPSSAVRPISRCASIACNAEPDIRVNASACASSAREALADQDIACRLIEPLAATTEQTLPELLRQAGVNVYANLTEPEFVVTNLMAGHLDDAGAAAGRFVVNSTLGLAGVFDPATALGLSRRPTEFGEALCALGVPTEPYLVLPLIGPTNAWSAGILTGFIVGGWYGLNFAPLPELRSPHGYLYACVLTLVLTVGMVIYLKKKRWF